MLHNESIILIIDNKIIKDIFILNKKKVFISIKCFILISILIFLEFIHLEVILKKKKLNFKKKKIKHIEAVLLMLPQHGNLGDHAITLAELNFLKQIFKKIKITYNLNNYTKYIHNNSLIFLQGGGNMGWRYKKEEINRRTIINAYPNNSIIIFPQTIYFENIYKQEENKTKYIYSNHKKLTIIARERESLKIMKTLFKQNTVLFSPDIVTYLDNFIDLKNLKRKGALLLLRKDREKRLNETLKKSLFSIIKKMYNKVTFADNQIKKKIMTLYESRKEVALQLKKIAKSEIVITDRLHGMIFSVITQTSCIVFRNYNHKLSSSYQWFKNLNYIKFLDDFNIKRFENLVRILKKKKTKNIYNKKMFNNYYNNLIKYILNLA